MIKNLSNILLFVIMLLLSVAVSYSNNWAISYIEFLVIFGLLKLLKGNLLWGGLFVILGTILVDVMSYQVVGLTALFVLIAFCIFRILEKTLAPVENQSQNLKTLFIFILYLIISGVYYFGQDVLDFGQNVWVGCINILILTLVLIVNSFFKKTGNDFRI